MEANLSQYNQSLNQVPIVPCCNCGSNYRRGTTHNCLIDLKKELEEQKKQVALANSTIQQLIDAIE